MLSKRKKEKNIMPTSKNPTNNNNNKTTLLISKFNSKTNSNKSENKFNLKRIKNNSIPSFADKKKEKKEFNKKKINLRNLNQIDESQKTIPIKKNQVIKRINNAKTQDNLMNICKLDQFLKNTDLKQTIIIDDEGNNNLDLIINEKNKYSDRKTKSKKDNNIDVIKEDINNENLNSEFTSLFLEPSYKNNLINNDSNEKKNKDNYNIIHRINTNTNRILNKNETKSQDKDSKRLNEYSQIFQLLNDNIEQFKNIINKKDNNLDNKEGKKNQNINRDSINKINILSSKENKGPKNIKELNINEKVNQRVIFNKNKNYQFIKKNKPNNLNLDEITINNSLSLSKDKKNVEIYSFLDSFTQDDILKSIETQHQKKSSKSLTNIFQAEKKDENNIKINKKEVDRISSNEMSTNNKCYEDEEIQIEVCGTDEQIKYDKIKNRDINPHFFSNDFVNNIENEKKKVNIDKECFIF